MFHDFLPSVWRRCIRPTVVNMRKAIEHEFIKRRCINERKRRSYKFFFSVFEKRRSAIIRLIRLVSEGVFLGMLNKLLVVDIEGVCV